MSRKTNLDVKRYIKELADRINSLESQIQPTMPHQDVAYQPMHEDTSPRAYQEFSPTVENQLLSRKRTYSMSEGLPNTFVQPQFGQAARPSSVGGWPVQDPAKDTADNLDVYNGVADKASQPFWVQEGASAERQAVVEPYPLVPIDEKVLDM
jgi:hypothetical protein